MKHSNAHDATACIMSGQRIFIHGAAATPHALIAGIISHADRLTDVELIHLHTDGDAAYAAPEYRESFRVANLFVGHNMRARMDGDRVDYLPCFLSEIPQLFRSGRRPIDVAAISVSPPGPHGFCTLGPSVDVAQAAVKAAKVVIAQVNQQMPRVAGGGLVHQSEIDHWIEVDHPLPEAPPARLDATHTAIGQHVAGLVEDGATLQMGIGAVPDAVLAALVHHRHLGVHTEMFSDGLLPLLESGVVDNSLKHHHPGNEQETRPKAGDPTEGHWNSPPKRRPDRRSLELTTEWPLVLARSDF
ncbi:MAG: 4-hydroxybutyrate CoA-transferase [Myxococcota bacterium]|jgi:4-hydroxybutyrate CoA-transferase